MSKDIIKTIIGVFALPLVAAVSIAFYGQFGNIDIFLTKGQQYFLMGVASYCLMQLLMFKPVYAYVLGHESVHALAGWICLGKVTSFNVTSAGGSVTTSKNNIFISLSPYFVPIYAIVITVLYYVVADRLIEDVVVQPYYMFLLGATLAFHLVMTVDTLKTKQPDLIKTGYLTSGVLIYIINLLVISGVLHLLFTGFSYRTFLGNFWRESAGMYRSIFTQLFL